MSADGKKSDEQAPIISTAWASDDSGEVVPERMPTSDENEEQADSKAGAKSAQRTAKPRTDDIPMPSPKRRPSDIVVYHGWCKACGICVEFCPTHVLERGQGGYAVVAHPNKCISCDLCELLCPDFAIMLTRPEASSG
jgi:2-oxoglutarate ferredoxin oxidoreductase subunit delta